MANRPPLVVNIAGEPWSHDYVTAMATLPTLPPTDMALELAFASVDMTLKLHGDAAGGRRPQIERVVDVEIDSRQVKSKDIKALAKENGEVPQFQTSAHIDAYLNGALANLKKQCDKACITIFTSSMYQGKRLTRSPYPKRGRSLEVKPQKPACTC